MPITSTFDKRTRLYCNQQHSGVTPNWFDPDYWKRNNHLLKTASGRGEVWFVDTPTGQAVLRKYRRGGFIAKFNKYRFAFQSWNSTRPFMELELLEYMVSKDLNVPTPIAGLCRRYGLFYEAWLLTETIPNASDLYNWILEGKQEQLNWQAIGNEIKRLHDADVFHSDLNCHNIMVDELGKVWIIDFDKCEQRSMTQALRDNNLNRLQRSFDKETEKHDAFKIEKMHLKHLLEGYANG